jgi:hypothetical protein
MSIFMIYAHNSCVSYTGHNATRFRNFILCAKGSSVHVYFLSYEACEDRFALVVSNLKAAYVHMETLSRRRNYKH